MSSLKIFIDFLDAATFWMDNRSANFWMDDRSATFWMDDRSANFWMDNRVVDITRIVFHHQQAPGETWGYNPDRGWMWIAPGETRGGMKLFFCTNCL